MLSHAIIMCIIMTRHVSGKFPINVIYILETEELIDLSKIEKAILDQLNSI